MIFIKKTQFCALVVAFLIPFVSFADVLVGAERTAEYLPLIKGKRVALVVNQTSRVGSTLLPDTLLALGIKVQSIMAPEHGFRGDAEAGEHIKSDRDPKTGLRIHSLYGKTKKPTPQMLQNVDVVMFDIQDVGCRFYTYLSTLYYVIEACREQNKQLIVLDRPNPNDTIDGPTLQPAFKSFVGIIPIPLMHGCTLGELAKMIAAGEFANRGKGVKPAKFNKLAVIHCEGWKHGEPYSLPVAPSKNLRNDHAIALYPSLCLFEGSEVSVGRGTDIPFEMFQAPNGEVHNLVNETAPRGFSLRYYFTIQKEVGKGWITRRDFFNKLAGTDKLYNQLQQGMSEEAIRASWQPGLNKFRTLRDKYLLY